MRHAYCRRIAFVAAAVLCIAPALAGPGPRHGHGPFPDGAEHLHRMLERLDLSETQREQVDELLAQRRETLHAKLDQMRERHLALMDAVHAESFDEAAIRDSAAAFAVTQADLAVERAALLSEVRGVLTPEQREEVRQMLERHRGFRESGGEFGGRRHHRGRGPRDAAPQELDD